jgi:hypothetical protein
MLASNPETPPEVASLARKIATSAGEMIDRTIRTFDQVRDPGAFIIEIDEELNSLETHAGDRQALAGLMQQLIGGQQGPTQPQLPAPASIGGP